MIVVLLHRDDAVYTWCLCCRQRLGNGKQFKWNPKAAMALKHKIGMAGTAQSFVHCLQQMIDKASYAIQPGSIHSWIYQCVSKQNWSLCNICSQTKVDGESACSALANYGGHVQRCMWWAMSANCVWLDEVNSFTCAAAGKKKLHTKKTDTPPPRRIRYLSIADAE